MNQAASVKNCIQVRTPLNLFVHPVYLPVLMTVCLLVDLFVCVFVYLFLVCVLVMFVCLSCLSFSVKYVPTISFFIIVLFI